jgi:membrane protease YdiL (CAAX protease family)
MMELLETDPWFRAIGTFQFFACIAAWIFLIGRWRRNGTLLPYERRRPVPWGPAGALLAILFTVISISAAFASGGDSGPVAQQSPEEQMLGLVASMVMQSLGPILLLFLAASCNARWSDVGVPARSEAWNRDITIGVVACLAAIIPVGIANYAARAALKMPDELTKHPLVEMLIHNEPDILVFALSTLMAVVAAPIAEEITFRLMLQGTLEKWEDRQLGWRSAETFSASSELLTATDDSGSTVGIAVVDRRDPTPNETPPPPRGIGGLRYGWTPILLSSLLFALAHYGYGPEPIPLFVLALILGYCYQRTHRIVPCIVAHGMFNLLSMIALWRVLFITAD